MINVAVTKLPHAEGIDLPAYATEHSAGLDLCAAVVGDLVLEPGARTLVPTGLCIALPEGYEAQVRPRSGLALKHGITVLNSPGTIDADYRGEVMVLLYNFGDSDFEVLPGTRVAQLVVARHETPVFEETDTLEDSSRGEGGFGHTALRDA